MALVAVVEGGVRGWSMGGSRQGARRGRSAGGCTPCREPRAMCHVPVRSHGACQGTAGIRWRVTAWCEEVVLLRVRPLGVPAAA